LTISVNLTNYYPFGQIKKNEMTGNVVCVGEKRGA